jgi:peroxiredoxin
MTNRGQWIALGGVLAAVAAVLGAALAMSGDLAPVGVGNKAPAFEAVTLAKGDSVGLDRFAGEVVLLNIWATWCAPCEQEMPSIERLYREMSPEGLKILSVSTDDADPETVRQWLAERKLTFEVFQDRTHAIERIYQTTGIPESFVIDRHGVIVKKVIGPLEWDGPAQKALFRHLLSEPGEPKGGG